MRYWLLRRPFDTPQPSALLSIEELRSAAFNRIDRDQHIALLKSPIDSVDWVANAFFVYRDGKITDLSAVRGRYVHDQEQSTINALWMSLLARDRAAIREVVGGQQSEYGLVEISQHCWKRLFINQEFPLGNALRLLVQHFYGSYKDAFGEIHRNANSGRATQWVAAADFLFSDIQQRFIEPAYWGRAAKKQWSKLGAVLQDAAPWEAQVFRAPERSPAAAGRNAQLPIATATQPDADSGAHVDFHIPFGDLVEIADAWDPELSADGKVRSRALEFLKSNTRFFLNVDTNELPPFPGGLNDEV